MRRMTRFRSAVFMFSLLNAAIPAFAGNEAELAAKTAQWKSAWQSHTPAQMITALETMNHAAEAQKGNAKSDAAFDAWAAAAACLVLHPRTAGCLYARAVAIGIYTSENIFGYQSRLRSMIDDSKSLAQIDPAYADGGAFRIPAQIYSELPAIGLGGLRKDLNQAEQHITRALQYGPKNPDNLVTGCKISVERNEWEKARTRCANAEIAIAAATTDPSYREWQNTLENSKSALEKHPAP